MVLAVFNVKECASDVSLSSKDPLFFIVAPFVDKLLTADTFAEESINTLDCLMFLLPDVVSANIIELFVVKFEAAETSPEPETVV